MRLTSPRAARLAVAALLLLGGVAALPTEAAPSTKHYGDAVAPATPVPLGTATQVRVTLTNCGPCGSLTSTQPFGSAEVSLPAVGTWAEPVVTVTGSSAAAGKSAAWSASPRTGTSGGPVYRLTNRGTGTSSAVAPGESVTLSLTLSATRGGPAVLTTSVKQSNDYSGTGNEFARVTQGALTLHIGSGPPASLAFSTQPSTVQVSTSTPAAAGAKTVMCPAPAVTVRDAQGNQVTWLPPTTVTLTTHTGDAGLRLAGSTTLAATTSGGVATFGTASCASGLTATQVVQQARLSAAASWSGTALSAPPSAAFDALPYYAACGDTCSTPVLAGRDTSAQVDAAGGTGAPDLLSFGVGLSGDAAKTPQGCNPDPFGVNPHRNTVLVDLADHSKRVTLTWSKQAVQWATNNGTPFWDVCFESEYPFTAKRVTPAGTPGWHAGTLLPCDQVDPLAQPCVERLFRNAGLQHAVVRMPNRNGDPYMW